MLIAAGITTVVDITGTKELRASDLLSEASSSIQPDILAEGQKLPAPPFNPRGSRSRPIYIDTKAEVSNPDSSQSIDIKIGGYTLHIPSGYVDTADGYQGPFGYLKIHALLPCLEPETAANTAEFHKNTLGKVLVAFLKPWEPSERFGETLLNIHLKNSEFVKSKHPDEYRDFNNTGIDVPGTDFQEYKDILLSHDIFVQRNTDPLFLLVCMKFGKIADRNGGVPFPHCSVRERIWQNDVYIQYEYERTWIDRDNLSNSTKIDRQVRMLFDSFLNAPGTPFVNKGENCE